MNGFTYFLPKAPAAGPATLTALGIPLEHPQQAAQGPIDLGPGQTGGVLVRDGRMTGPLSYDPDRQTWRPGNPEKTFWLGWPTQQPPGPEDLARETLLDGRAVKLADGREWIVPVARLLPQQYGLSERGTPVQRVAQRYQELWDDAWTFLRAYSDPDQGVSYERALATACAALAANYQVGMPELLALELLDQQNLLSVCQTLIDWEFYLAQISARTAEKKTAPAAGPTTNSGGAA